MKEHTIGHPDVERRLKFVCELHQIGNGIDRQVDWTVFFDFYSEMHREENSTHISPNSNMNTSRTLEFMRYKLVYLT